MGARAFLEAYDKRLRLQAMFLRVMRHGKLPPRIASRNDVTRTSAPLAAQEAARFSAYSLRTGFAVTAADSGATVVFLWPGRTDTWSRSQSVASGFLRNCETHEGFGIHDLRAASKSENQTKYMKFIFF